MEGSLRSVFRCTLSTTVSNIASNQHQKCHNSAKRRCKDETSSARLGVFSQDNDHHHDSNLIIAESRATAECRLSTWRPHVLCNMLESEVEGHATSSSSGVIERDFVPLLNSYISTSSPRCAAYIAASVPTGPAPMTMIFCLFLSLAAIIAKGLYVYTIVIVV